VSVHVQVTWLDARETVTAQELCQACGMSLAELDELVEYGALVPHGTAQAARSFSGTCVVPLRRAAQLRRAYDLDLFTVSVLLGYLNRIEELEREVQSLRAHLPRHTHMEPREGPGPWREPHG